MLLTLWLLPGGAITTALGETGDRVVARVGEATITAAEVEARMAVETETLRFKELQARAAFVHGMRQAYMKALMELVEGRAVESEAREKELPAAEIRTGLDTDEERQELWKRQRVAVLEVPRQSFDTLEAPALGPPDAPITLTVFGDFTCPYSARLVPVLDEVRQRYGERIRIVFRSDPLAISQDLPFRAAEAAVCAQEQGRFWELYRLFFREQDRLLEEGLEGLLPELALDGATFRDCLASGRAAERVRSEQAAAARAGVVGTPFVFVNGILRGGNTRIDGLGQLIDEELALRAEMNP